MDTLNRLRRVECQWHDGADASGEGAGPLEAEEANSARSADQQARPQRLSGALHMRDDKQTAGRTRTRRLQSCSVRTLLRRQAGMDRLTSTSAVCYSCGMQNCSITMFCADGHHEPCEAQCTKVAHTYICPECCEIIAQCSPSRLCGSWKVSLHVQVCQPLLMRASAWSRPWCETLVSAWSMPCLCSESGRARSATTTCARCGCTRRSCTRPMWSGARTRCFVQR